MDPRGSTRSSATAAWPAGTRRVTRLMRRPVWRAAARSAGGRRRRRPRGRSGQDLIQRHFGPCAAIDRRYVGDITYIATWEGWAYLATVIDLASRKVVGWALADHMSTELVEDALTMAFDQPTT